MSFDWAGIAQSVGQGASHGLALHKKETKDNEQQQYERGREAAQDQQKAELHGQTVKQNDFTLQNSAREQAEANRKQLLSDRLGMYQNFKTIGDVDRAASTYIDFANKDNINNPNFDQNHSLAYVKNQDGTVNINIVDKNTGALIRTAKEKASIDDFVSATYQQLDPTKSYETQVDNAAKSALKQQEYAWDERKMGLQNGYDINKENNKFNNDYRMEGYKFGNNMQLEGVRQQGSNYRAELSQEGANYRTGITQDGLNYRDGNNGTGKGSKGSASNAVASGVQGAIGFAQQNAPMLSFLSNQPDLYNKTIAMMGIESAGNPNAFSGSSHGLMQINGQYAQGFARQFGVSGNPVNNVQANIQTGAALINHLDKKYSGDTTLIAAAYNAGEPAIDKAVAKWQKSGRQGSWFDHLNLEPAARQQVYGHIVKFNQALGYLGAGGQPTNMTPQQQSQNNAQQSTQAKVQYRKDMSAQTTASIKSTATSMTTELGVKKGESAAFIGGLSGAQTEIAKFANGNTKAERMRAYQNVLTTVENVVKSTEAGQIMTPAQRIEYVHQKAAEMVGATNKAEAGSWINDGRFPQQAAKPKPQSNLNSNEIDNVFGEINVGSVQQQAQAKPAAKSGGAFVPIRNPMPGDRAIKAASRFEPPKTIAKAAPAAKPAAKPMDARTARKQAQIDAMNKRIAAEKAQEEKLAVNPAVKAATKPAATNQQARALFGTSTVEASKALKLRLQQNKS